MPEENTAVGGEAVEQTTGTSAGAEQTTDSGVSGEATTSEKMPNSSESNKDLSGQAIPYERFKEVNDKYKTLSSELESYKSKAELLDKLQQDPELARSVLKNVNIEPAKDIDPSVKAAMDVLRENGFLTRDDVEREFQTREQQRMQEQAQEKIVSSFQRQIQEISEKYKGDDGMPPADAEAIAGYMDSNGIIWGENGEPDVEAVYFLLNREAIIDAQAKKVRQTPFTEKAGNADASKEDVQSMIQEAREQGDFSNVFKTFLKK